MIQNILPPPKTARTLGLTLSYGLSALLGLPTPRAAAEAKTLDAERIAQLAEASVVRVSHFNRHGSETGVGSGFVVSRDGLIATSLHVIDEARPIAVRFANGHSYEVSSIYAWDRTLDLAVLRVEAEALTPLPLGDSSQLRPGQPVVAVGNPFGLENSVVEGVVSGIRHFESRDMIQLAIPIEPGNSGGPLLDLHGRVQGLLNMKSTLSENLGFATTVNPLKSLLKKPNPITMDRWLRLGALDPDEWDTLFGARWSQKTGRIEVSGAGKEFGGRALCLYRQAPPDRPYEIEVNVRLNDESGAAGLAFCADGRYRHYGFYPSNGTLRLTRFDGPTVYTWTILKQISSAFYRPGEWNHLKVRLDSAGIQCFVNGHRVIESKDAGLTSGRAGLAKFRDTYAEFKGFRFQAGRLPLEPQLPQDLLSEIDAQLGTPSAISQAEMDRLTAFPEKGRTFILKKAEEYEQHAVRLRAVAETVYRRSIQSKLVQELNQEEDQIDLLYAALLISRYDNPDLDIPPYQRQVERMAAEIRQRITPHSNSEGRLRALLDYLFKENGYHGSRGDYENRANSYLDQVIDDREGIPITLSVLVMELGNRVGVPRLAGLSLPGHFLVRFVPDKGSSKVIDPFQEGRLISFAEADAMASQYQRTPVDSKTMPSATKRAIITRMLINLQAFTQRKGSPRESLPYLDLVIALNPENPEFHLERSWLRIRSGDAAGAKEDLKWILDRQPPGVDLPRIAEAYRSL